MTLLALLACVPQAVDGTDDKPGETGDTADDPTDLELDDARVRALTGLPEGASPCAEPQLVRVLETVDGDTFHACPDGDDCSPGKDRYFRVRMIGVDTPEVEHETPAECYGDDAWDYSAARLEGKLVWLTFDAECLDVYDRSLAYVFRDSDEAGFFNRSLVRNGYATVLTISPNDTYADLFQADARDARDEGLGLWSSCDR